MAGRNELPPLSDVQLEVMTEIWKQASASVADVSSVLKDRRGVSRNTVHTLIVRLEEKGWLRRQENADGVRYSATVSQTSTQQQCVRRLIDTVFDGSPEGLVLTLLNDKTVSSNDADRIRKLIAKAKRSES